MKRLLFFIHIPKTAGTTFSAILDRNFRRSSIVDVYPNFGIAPDEFRELPGDVMEHVECVKGHFDYGIHRGVERPFTYTTFLRDPVEQVRSRYNHVRSSRFHPLHYLVKRGLTLEDFARQSPDNFQTRTLNEIEPRPGKNHPEIDERHLERAKENIERHFAAVGITERFDESLLVLQDCLRLRRVSYVRRNVRRRRKAGAPLSQAVRKAIEDTTRLDLALYRWADARLDEAIGTRREWFQDELRSFRKANSRYSSAMWLPDRISHRLSMAHRFLRYVQSRGRRTR